MGTLPDWRYGRTGLTLGSAAILSVVVIPAAVVGASLALVLLFLPVYAGAYVEFGIVPWESHRRSVTLSGWWWLGLGLWLTVLSVGGVRTWRRLTAFT